MAMMAAYVSSALFGVVFWIIATRTMSTDSVGFVSTISSTTFLITIIATLGMDVALTRYLPTSKNKAELISTVIISILLVAVLLSILFVAGIRWLAPELSFLREGLPFVIFLIFVVFSSLNVMLNVTFTTIRKSVAYFLQNMLLGLRIPILYFIAPLGVLGAMGSICIAYIISNIYSIYMLYRCKLPIKLKINTAMLREITSFSMGNYVASIFTIAPGMAMPLIIVSTLGASESAYYYIAYSIANMLFMIPSAIASSLFIEGSYETPLKNNVIKSIRSVLMLLLPLIVLILIFGDKILLIFSKEYSVQSVVLLKLLAMSSLPSSIVSIYLVVKRIQKNIMAINSITFTISALIIGIAYFSLSRIGLTGLGYLWLGVYSIIGTILAVLLYRDILMNKASLEDKIRF